MIKLTGVSVTLSRTFTENDIRTVPVRGVQTEVLDVTWYAHGQQNGERISTLGKFSLWGTNAIDSFLPHLVQGRTLIIGGDAAMEWFTGSKQEVVQQLVVSNVTIGFPDISAADVQLWQERQARNNQARPSNQARVTNNTRTSTNQRLAPRGRTMADEIDDKEDGVNTSVLSPAAMKEFLAWKSKQDAAEPTKPARNSRAIVAEIEEPAPTRAGRRQNNGK